VPGIRAATIGDARVIAGINVEVWRAAYRGIVPDAYLDTDLDIAVQTQRWSQALTGQPPGSTVITEIAGTAAGYACGGPGRGGASSDGELYAIYVRPQHQRRGVGRMLVAAVVEHCRNRGLLPLRVWVLKDNLAARSFYETLGGIVCDEQLLHLHDHALSEVCYRWTDSLPLQSQGGC